MFCSLHVFFFSLFFWAIIVPIMGILIGFLTGFVGSFYFGWRWWTICLVYYWLVLLVLSNIFHSLALFLEAFNSVLVNFIFLPCFFFFEDLSFQWISLAYGFKFSSLPFKKGDTFGFFSSKKLYTDRKYRADILLIIL